MNRSGHRIQAVRGSTRLSEHPPEYKEGMYLVTYKCGNCGRTTTVLIKKRVFAPKKLDRPCPNCGCYTLRLT